MVGRMRSRVTVIAVSIACTGLTLERHLISNLERLTQRQDDFGRLVLQLMTNWFHTRIPNRHLFAFMNISLTMEDTLKT